MGDLIVCDCPPEAGNVVCELPAQGFIRPARPANSCPECNQAARLVQGQTVKAMLLVSLRAVYEVGYYFCHTPACPVVYFSSDGTQMFAADEVRERVYQKEPQADDVLVCYCFCHTVGNLRNASPDGRALILGDINTGIGLDQCACDLRNPQGACCLGNVHGLIKQYDRKITNTAS